jgi:5'-nucleotidase
VNEKLPSLPPPARRIHCNRTLNLRSIGAIGYDMDYTLVHYRVEEWEGHAYEFIRASLAEDGWPVDGLSFEPDLIIRGLVLDLELGNILKANRFGYVIRATHGTRDMAFEEVRDAYRQTQVDLAEPRFVFLNTLFSLSEGCLFAQLVDRFDETWERFEGVASYAGLYRSLSRAVDRAHVEGALKADILRNPAQFIATDPDTAATLLDQKRAGKRLMLISNAEWPYAREVMRFAFDPYLPDGMSWRDLFELVILQARKPGFFSQSLPLFTVEDEDEGLLKPCPGAIPGPGVYVGGDAFRVEEYLGLSGSRILYVGDHVFADVRVSKAELRWRTALILRELEDDLREIVGFADTEGRLKAMMEEKIRFEHALSTARLDLLRSHHGESSAAGRRELEQRITSLRDHLVALDETIAPLARQASTLVNRRWGPLLRAGNATTHLAQQLEKSADVYTSRVSNFLDATPFAYLRSQRSSMPHDPATETTPGAPEQ